MIFRVPMTDRLFRDFPDELSARAFADEISSTVLFIEEPVYVEAGSDTEQGESVDL